MNTDERSTRMNVDESVNIDSHMQAGREPRLNALDVSN